MFFHRYICRHRKPRGFSMLMAVGLIACLSVGAAIILEQSGGLSALAGALSRSSKTLSAARDGASAGVTLLSDLLYPGGQPSLSLTNVQALPTLQAGDPLCADGVICGNWRLLRPQQAVGTEGATARIGVTCNPGGCTGSPNAVVNFQVRSLGRLASGDARLIEMTVKPSGS